MENSFKTYNDRLVRWFALAIVVGALPAFTLGRCTAPTPQPVLVTETVTETVEVIEYLPSNPQRECLARAIYAEARSEPYNGQLAVGQVILNRVKDSRYPNTICEVVRYKNRGTYHFSYQDKRDPNFYKTARVFSDMKTNVIEVEAREKAYEIADMVLAGQSILPISSLNYHRADIQPDWSYKLAEVKQVGKHIFYTGY